MRRDFILATDEIVPPVQCYMGCWERCEKGRENLCLVRQPSIVVVEVKAAQDQDCHAIGKTQSEETRTSSFSLSCLDHAAIFGVQFRAGKYRDNIYLD